MSNHLFTADLHLGHKLVSNIRGFASTAEHDFYIIKRLRAAVRPDDILWILGDYSVSKHRYARELLSWVPGRKVLIAGNHDPEHPMHRDAWKKQRESMETFDAVLPYQRIKLSGAHFMMSHLPYGFGGDHTEGERYSEYRLTDWGLPLLCGHVHEAWKLNGNQFNVGLDVNDFKPVTANELVAWRKESRGEAVP